MSKMIKRIDEIADEELKRANEKFPLFTSDHEGIAVLAEEIVEATEDADIVQLTCERLWQSVRKDAERKEKEEQVYKIEFFAKEAVSEYIQVIAMCKKFIASMEKRNGDKN